MLETLRNTIARCWKQTFCLHTEREHYGGFHPHDQSGRMYLAERCARCGKGTDCQYMYNEGRGHTVT